MRHSSTKLAFLIVLGLFFTACERNQRFSDVPLLEWRKAEFRFVGDSADNRRVLDLTVYFTDGDGDIGREDENSGSDTCNLNNYQAFLNRFDLFIHYYERVNGAYQEVAPPDSCLPFHNILPNLTPVGQNKTLEGDITTPFDYSNFPANAQADSIKFEFELKDRSGNTSGRVFGEAIAI